MANKIDKHFRTEIPGENLTASNESYPWRNPPQYADFDEAFEFIVDTKFADMNALKAGMNMAAMGVSVVSLTQTMLIQQVAKGRITPDMSLLLAGPVYKTFTKLLDAANIKYLTGFDNKKELEEFAGYLKAGGPAESRPTKAKVSLTPEQEKEMERISEEATASIPEGGLMGAPTEGEDMEIPMDENTSQALVMAPSDNANEEEEA